MIDELPNKRGQDRYSQRVKPNVPREVTPASAVTPVMLHQGHVRHMKAPAPAPAPGNIIAQKIEKSTVDDIVNCLFMSSPDSATSTYEQLLQEILEKILRDKSRISDAGNILTSFITELVSKNPIEDLSTGGELDAVKISKQLGDKITALATDEQRQVTIDKILKSAERDLF